jgi:hypothetical protein
MIEDTESIGNSFDKFRVERLLGCVPGHALFLSHEVDGWLVPDRLRASHALLEKRSATPKRGSTGGSRLGTCSPTLLQSPSRSSADLQIDVQAAIW